MLDSLFIEALRVCQVAKDHVTQDDIFERMLAQRVEWPDDPERLFAKLLTRARIARQIDHSVTRGWFLRDLGVRQIQRLRTRARIAEKTQAARAKSLRCARAHYRIDSALHRVWISGEGCGGALYVFGKLAIALSPWGKVITVRVTCTDLERAHDLVKRKYVPVASEAKAPLAIQNPACL